MKDPVMVYGLSVLLLATGTVSPTALAEVPEGPQGIVEDIIQSCSHNTIGDTVGYSNQPTTIGPSLANSYLIADLDYVAIGVFSGGNYEKRDGAWYFIYTIQSGYSMDASWCDNPSIRFEAV